jgi:hypothetical protein
MGRDGRTQKANGEEDTPFLARSYAKATAKRTLWYRYCLALIFGLSLFLNIISLEQLTRKESTLDRVCNDYTSESRELSRYTVEPLLTLGRFAHNRQRGYIISNRAIRRTIHTPIYLHIPAKRRSRTGVAGYRRRQ